MRKRDILTPRQLEILSEAYKSSLLKKGVDRDWIASNLGIEKESIDRTLSQIYCRLQVYDVFAAYFYATKIYNILQPINDEEIITKLKRQLSLFDIEQD